MDARCRCYRAEPGYAMERTMFTKTSTLTFVGWKDTYGDQIVEGNKS